MSEHTPAPTSSRAVYGFTLQLSFKLLFVIYLAWAIVPEEWFESVGITYLPQRYWAIAVPIFLLTAFATFAFVIYPGLGLIMTPNWDDIRTIEDTYSMSGCSFTDADHPLRDQGECCIRNKQFCKKSFFETLDQEDFIKNCIPPMKDLDIVSVSEHLYLK